MTPVAVLTLRLSTPASPSTLTKKVLSARYSLVVELLEKRMVVESRLTFWERPLSPPLYSLTTTV